MKKIMLLLCVVFGLNMTMDMWYWSSTERDATHAFAIRFQTGYIQSHTAKSAQTYVRAIRHF